MSNMKFEPFVKFHQEVVKRINGGLADDLKTSSKTIYCDRLKKWVRGYCLNIILILYLAITSPLKFYFGFIHRMITVFTHIPKTRNSIYKYMTYWQIIIGLLIIPYIIFYLSTCPIYLLIDIIKFIKSGYDLNSSKLYNQTLRLCIFCESWIQLIYLLKHNHGSYEIAEFDKNFYHKIFDQCGIYRPVSYVFENNKWHGKFPQQSGDILVKPVDGAQGFNHSFWKYDTTNNVYYNGDYHNNNNKKNDGDDGNDENKSLSKDELIEYVEKQSKDKSIGYNAFMIQNYIEMNKNWGKKICEKYHILLRISTIKLNKSNESKIVYVPFLAELTISNSWTSHKRLGVIYCDVNNGKAISFVNNWFGEKLLDKNVKLSDFDIPNELYSKAVSLAVEAHKCMPDNILPDHSWDILLSNQGICFLEGSYFGARCTHYFYDSFAVINQHLTTYDINLVNIVMVVIATPIFFITIYAILTYQK